uniref:Uncharacterized protein n=1 Tax=Octopus bimaculoides TaxID=37653 RepID=A0A0L8HF92_OCTBM
MYVCMCVFIYLQYCKSTMLEVYTSEELRLQVLDYFRLYSIGMLSITSLVLNFLNALFNC